MAKIKLNRILQNNFGNLVKKTVFIVISTILVSGFVYFSDNNFNSIPTSLAGAEHSLSGFAWSETIGWISFNNTTGGGAVNYGVNIDMITGNLSGYAWSENIGWIKFDPIGPYPFLPNNSAKLDITTNQITGWARACAGTVSGDCISASRTDGWDGWIKMSGTALDGSGYGVTRSSGANCGLSGYAWGSDVVGWIHFQGTAIDGSAYGVKLPLCGVCGSADGVFSADEPPAIDRCLSGGASSVAGGNGNPWTWMCLGSDNATTDDDASCSAPSPVVCTPTIYTYGECQCPEEKRSKTDNCGGSYPNVDCDAAGKNSCRDFNYREVAP